MIRMQGEIVVRKPMDFLFDFVADARNEQRYNPIIIEAEMVSDGPVCTGSRFRNKTRSLGRTTEWSIEITTFERPYRLETCLSSAAADIKGRMVFKAVKGGTRMRWHWDSKPRGFYRLAGPFFRFFGQRLEERNWENLKQFLETQ